MYRLLSLGTVLVYISLLIIPIYTRLPHAFLKTNVIQYCSRLLHEIDLNLNIRDTVGSDYERYRVLIMLKDCHII